MSPDEFQEIVDQTINELPEEFKSKIENVDVVVEDWPVDEGKRDGGILYGLYRGVPKTKRGNYYSGVLPDKITIFAGPILYTSKDLEEAKEKIKETVLHEIGHYFGLSDKQIYGAMKD